MSKTQSPQTKIRGRVGDATEAVLNCVYRLIHHNFTEDKLEKEEIEKDSV